MTGARRLLLLCFVLLTAGCCFGQAEYAGIGPGSYTSLGVTFSGFRGDYGQRTLAGPTVFLDANLYRRVGVEAEYRDLRLHTDESIRERNYLIGPKLALRGHTVRPFGKFLVGRGQFDFPFGYAHGSYFVLAPGAGLDWRIARSRFLLRIVDFEYQIWPGFSFGQLRPYGASSGISLRLF